MADPIWLETARSYLGTRERPKGAHNPTILDFFLRAGHGWVDADEVPWCAAFVGAVLGEAGLTGSGELTARSYLKWGHPMPDEMLGAIAVFRRGRASWQGHVGFVTGANATHLAILGGNQSNAVTIADYPRTKLLGLRWPEGVMRPATTLLS